MSTGSVEAFMKPRTPASLCALAVASLLLGACGGSVASKRPATATPTTTAPVAASAGATPAPSLVRYGRWTDNNFNAGMPVIRGEAQSVTRLADGSLLITSALTGPGGVTDAHVYLCSPVCYSWNGVPNMQTSRAGFTATRLPSGKVLVAGGYGPDMHRTPTAELYDPASNSWSSTGSMVVGRVNFAAAALADGRVLAVGGRIPSGPITNAEIYDPASGRWAAVPNMSTPRERPTATTLSDGRVLVAGGVIRDGPTLYATASTEIYDPRTNGWTAAASMRVARADHTATLLLDGKVFVAGNGGDAADSTEVYDPATNAWSAAARMPIDRRSHVAVRLNSGQVLLLGGLFGQSGFSATADLYDPAKDTWSTAGEMGGLRGEVRASLLDDGRVVVVGADWAVRTYQPNAT
jgi:hypothetical protein